MISIYETHFEEVNNCGIAKFRVISIPEISGFSLHRTEQNRIVIGLKSIYKGLLPRHHIKYTTK
jgi:hypothetical protein